MALSDYRLATIGGKRRITIKVEILLRVASLVAKRGGGIMMLTQQRSS